MGDKTMTTDKLAALLALAEDAANDRTRVIAGDQEWADPQLASHWSIACSPEVVAALVKVAMATMVDGVHSAGDRADWCPVCDALAALDAALTGD